jgi:hypothetical protein
MEPVLRALDLAFYCVLRRDASVHRERETYGIESLHPPAHPFINYHAEGRNKRSTAHMNSLTQCLD